MGVGVDDDLAAELLGQAQVAVAQVEALGCGVVLDGDAQLGGAAQNRSPMSMANGSRRSSRRPVGWPRMRV